MPNLYSSDTDESPNKYFRHLGFSTTIQTSFAVLSMSQKGLTVLDGANLCSAESTPSPNHHTRYEGFSSTIKDSYATGYNTPAQSSSITWDGERVYGTTSNSLFFKHFGFSATVIDSFEKRISGMATGPTGLTWDGSNLIFNASVQDKHIKLDGFSETILDSFANQSNLGTDVGFDDPNIIETTALTPNFDKFYLHSGFSVTVLDSIIAPNTSPRGTSWGTTTGDNPCDLPEGTEQHRLDVVLDTNRPDWQRIGDILSLYRSAMIFSDGKYKVISDRDDLPVRQIFHAGNIVPESMVLKVGGDILNPNQVIVEYANHTLDFAQDVLYMQDSASVLSSLDPIRSFDMSAVGITRRSEAQRLASVHLQQRRRVAREVSFNTGLEALAVEPGDRARVGMLTTDFAGGYGGRALDGSSSHILLDREVTLLQSSTYEMVVWHTEADTPETRFVFTGEGNHLSLQPTVGFNFAVAAGDRWALGVDSEDLMKVTITGVTREESGLHRITALEYQPTFFTLDCPSSVVPVSSNTAPSQPLSATAVESDCVVSMSIVTAVCCEGSLLSDTRSDNILSLADLPHNPNNDSLIFETLTMVSGPASAQSTVIVSWTAASLEAQVSPAFTAAPNSGDPYYITFRCDTPAGFEVDAVKLSAYGVGLYGEELYGGSQGEGFQSVATIFGTDGVVNVLGYGNELRLRITPFSNRGLRNTLGRWTLVVNATGCDSIGAVTDGNTVTGLNEVGYFTTTLASNLFGTANRLDVGINGLISEICTPDSETTRLSLSLKYGSETVIDSLVITLSSSDAAGVGSEQAAFIDAALVGAGVTSKQSASLKYTGPTVTGAQVITKTGIGTVDSTLAHSFGIHAIFEHLDENGVSHPSHACFFLTFESGITDVTSV